MLQKDYLFEWRDIYSNVMLGLEIQKKRTPENIGRVERMLATYGLSAFQHVRPSHNYYLGRIFRDLLQAAPFREYNVRNKRCLWHF